MGCTLDVTGKELWHNEVIPHPDGPGDATWRGMPFENCWCTGVWGQIVYDPVQNLVHYGSSGICPASDYQRGVAGMCAAGQRRPSRKSSRCRRPEILVTSA